MIEFQDTGCTDNNEWYPMNTPIPHLPEPMTALDPKSWAFETVTRRWPEIAQRILSENKLPPAIQDRLRGLIADIPYGAIRLIEDQGAPDVGKWNTDITQHRGNDWLEPPWFFSEHYFYYQILI